MMNVFTSTKWKAQLTDIWQSFAEQTVIMATNNSVA